LLKKAENVKLKDYLGNVLVYGKKKEINISSVMLVWLFENFKWVHKLIKAYMYIQFTNHSHNHYNTSGHICSH